LEEKYNFKMERKKCSKEFEGKQARQGENKIQEIVSSKKLLIFIKII